ncbi:unnamed protein product [Caretta caretta]
MSQPPARSKEDAAEPLKRSTTRYVSMIKNLKDSFEERFQVLQQKRPQIRFLIDPFNAEADCLKPPLVTDEETSQMEIIEVLEDDRLKSVQKAEGTLTFWKSVPKDKYLNIRGAALKLISMFASTYLCESVFLNAQTCEIQAPSILIDSHLRELLYVSTTEHKPNFKAIVESKDCQKSH